MGCKVKNCVSYSIQLFMYTIVAWKTGQPVRSPFSLPFCVFFVLFFAHRTLECASFIPAVLLVRLVSMRDAMCRLKRENKIIEKRTCRTTLGIRKYKFGRFSLVHVACMTMRN